MKIEVLGSGCAKCNSTLENVKLALKELNRTAEVVKVTDLKAMIDRGVMMTPGVIIDGKVVSQGRTPTVEQVKQMIGKGGRA